MQCCFVFLSIVFYRQVCIIISMAAAPKVRPTITSKLNPPSTHVKEWMVRSLGYITDQYIWPQSKIFSHFSKGERHIPFKAALPSTAEGLLLLLICKSTALVSQQILNLTSFLCKFVNLNEMKDLTLNRRVALAI